MTVQSINNRVQTQTSAAAVGQASTGSTAEMAFLSALQSSLSYAGPSLLPSLPPTLTAAVQAQQPLPTPQAQPQPTEQPQPVQQAQAPQPTPRHSSDDQTQSSGNQQSSDQTDQTQQSAPAPAHQTGGNSASAAKAAATTSAKSDDHHDKSADDTTQAQVNDAVQTEVAAAQMQIVPQRQTAAPQVVEAPVQQATPSVLPTEIDPEDGKAPAETAERNSTAGQAGEATAPTPKFADLMAGQAADATATAPTAADQTAADQTAGQHGLADRLAQQKDDLSQMLAGTGAQVNIAVETTQAAPTAVQSGPQFGAKDDAVGTGLQAAPALDPIAAAITPSTPSADQNSSGDHGGGNAATALASGIAQDSSQITQVADAKTFAAALATQIDADAPVEPAGQTQPVSTGQPVAGGVATQATQATDKPAAAQAAQAPRQPSQLTQQQVVDQIKVQIAKQANGGADTIKIQLKPFDLGRIEIKLEVGHDGQVQATVTADNKDTLAMLQKDSSGLTKALSDAGLKSDSGSLSFNLRSDQQQQQQTANNGGGNQGGSGRSRRILSGIDASSSSTLTQAGATTGRSGVNISV